MSLVSSVTSFEKFLDLQREWNSLLEKSLSNSIFLSHDLIRCWWEAYGSGKKLLILLCKKDGIIVGISPLMMSYSSFRGFPIKKLSFVENDEIPHSGIITDRNADLKETVSAFINFIISNNYNWDILYLRKIPEDSKIIKYLSFLLTNKGYKLIVRPSLKSPILRSESNWATFYSQRTQRFKKRARYCFNKLNKHGNVQIQKIEDPEVIESNLKDVFKVGSASWKEKNGNAIGSNAENETFFSTLPSNLKNDNRVLLWTLRLNGEMIAFEYHIRQSNIVYALRAEFDEAYRSLGPGSALDFEVVRGLFEDDTQLYNMGGTPDEYKLRWTSEHESHLDIIVFNRLPYGIFLYVIEKKIILNLKRIYSFLNNRRMKG